jgi:large subunit ribosomal protein L21e
LPQTHGKRIKTRDLLSKEIREKGLKNLSKFMYEYKEGDEVIIKIDPSVHDGMPFRRFHGKRGEIVEKRGRAFLVKILDGNKEKFVVARPEHLMLVQKNA